MADRVDLDLDQPVDLDLDAPVDLDLDAGPESALKTAALAVPRGAARLARQVTIEGPARILEELRAGAGTITTPVRGELFEQMVGRLLRGSLQMAGAPFAFFAPTGEEAARGVREVGPQLGLPERLTEGLAVGAEAAPGLIIGGQIPARLAARPRVPPPEVTLPGARPVPPAPPAPAPRKALPAFGESGARRTFETGPSTTGKPSEFFRQLPKDVAEDRRVLLETVGRHIEKAAVESVDDVATKAAIIRAQRRGPRVVDPATGQPVFEPGEPISGPRAEATARVGREPVGRAGLPSEEFAASTEAPGGRAGGGGAPPRGRQPGGGMFELPDEGTPFGAGPKRGTGPPDVSIAVNVDSQFPPSAFPPTLADRAFNHLRALTGRLSPKRAANLGYDLHVAKAHPAADAIIQAKYRARALAERGAEQFMERYEALRATVPDEVVEGIADTWKRHRFQPREVWLAEAGKQYPQYMEYIAARQAMLDEIGQYFVKTGRLTEAQLAKNPNYYPFIRERVRVGQKELNLIEARGDAFFSVWRGSGLTKPFQEFFQREQIVKAVPKNLDDRTIMRVYSRAAARAQAVDAEFMPVVRGNLQGVPDNMKAFVTHNVNNFLGVPGAESAELAQWKGIIKSAQAQRTLVGLSAPAHNLTQQTITIAQYGPRFAMPAYRDLGNPELWALAKRLGVVSKYNVKDVGEALEFGNRALQAYGKMSNASLMLFRGTENLNRVHALATGLRAGQAQGLTGKALEQFAFRAVLDTQGPIVRTGVFGQFKTFPLFMVGKYTDMVQGAGAGIELFGKGFLQGNKAMMREGIRRSASFSRFLGLMTLLFGGDVVFPGLDEAVTKRLLGKAMKFEGALPYLGFHFGHVVGLGAIPFESWRSFLFFLPGPAASNVAEIASVVAGRRLNPFNVTDDKRGLGSAFLPTDVDEMRARLVKAIPGVGAIQANRIIEAARRLRTDGDVVASTNWWQAFALEPATGELIETREGVEPQSLIERLSGGAPVTRALTEAAGFRPAASEQIAQANVEIAERQRAITDTLHVASTMEIGDQFAKADAALDKIEREYGEEALAEVYDGLAKALNTKAYARFVDRQTRRIEKGSKVGLAARTDIAEQKPGVIDALVRGLTGR